MIIDSKLDEKKRDGDDSSSSSENSHERYDYGDDASEVAPPAYSGPPPASAGSSSSTTRDVGSGSEDNPTNGVVINNRYESIKGTWFLDPFLPPEPQSFISSILTSRSERERKRDRRRVGGTAPSATLNSHHGNVVANFAIVGPPNPSRAGIRVTTRHGDIRLDLFGKAPAKFVEFDVYSRHGHIVVFVPRSFSGVLELHIRRGRILTMPSLSTAAQTVKNARNEVVLLVGQGSQSPMGMGGVTPQFADLGKFYTRSGDISVGFTGEDDGHALQPQGFVQQVLKRIAG